MDKAIELRDSLTEKRKYDQEFGDQTWIVIDREGNDSNNRQNFIDALEAAQDNNIVVAHSNRAFELWCLLHLKYEDGQQLSVEELIRRLNKALKKAKTGYQYKKPGAKMYGYIERFQHQAIENAKKLEQKTGDLPPADADPSTSVYRLVEELNQIKQSSRRG